MACRITEVIRGCSANAAEPYVGPMSVTEQSSSIDVPIIDEAGFEHPVMSCVSNQ